MNQTSLELLLPKWEAIEVSPPVYLIQSEAGRIQRKHFARLGVVRVQHLWLMAIGQFPGGGFYEAGYVGHVDKTELHRLARLAGRCLTAEVFSRYVPASEPDMVCGSDVGEIPFGPHAGVSEWWALVFGMARRGLIPHEPRGQVTHWTGEDWEPWEPGLPVTRVAVLDSPAEASRFALGVLLESNTTTEPEAPAPPAGKGKRSTARGDARLKIIAALTRHHRYAQGSLLNQEPMGVAELATAAGASKSTASGFFTAEFKGHAAYKRTCRNEGDLIASLKMLNGEFSPSMLFGERMPDEAENPSHRGDRRRKPRASELNSRSY